MHVYLFCSNQKIVVIWTTIWHGGTDDIISYILKLMDKNWKNQENYHKLRDHLVACWIN